MFIKSNLNATDFLESKFIKIKFNDNKLDLIHKGLNLSKFRN